MIVVGIVVAGALGALARVVVHDAIDRRVGGIQPWGTIAVNVSGALVLGFVAGWTIHRGLDPDLRAIVTTGFLGAYTTFSTFVVEVVGMHDDSALHEGGGPSPAVRAIAISVGCGLVASTAGLALATLLAT